MVPNSINHKYIYNFVIYCVGWNMSKTFRFTDQEEEALNNVSLSVNKALVQAGKKPLRDSEIFHEIIKQTLLNGSIGVTEEGTLKVEVKK